MSGTSKHIINKYSKSEFLLNNPTTSISASYVNLRCGCDFFIFGIMPGVLVSSSRWRVEGRGGVGPSPSSFHHLLFYSVSLTFCQTLIVSLNDTRNVEIQRIPRITKKNNRQRLIVQVIVSNVLIGLWFPFLSRPTM